MTVCLRKTVWGRQFIPNEAQSGSNTTWNMNVIRNDNEWLIKVNVDGRRSGMI
jgi:hypothetical protein